MVLMHKGGFISAALKRPSWRFLSSYLRITNGEVRNVIPSIRVSPKLEVRSLLRAIRAFGFSEGGQWWSGNVAFYASINASFEGARLFRSEGCLKLAV